ncbi:Galactokinase [Candidatus Ornithobacterium hominis]|uniref:Galactokinase n=1 Tax=Candidatus Ornithobacterium hominis TaxID=2497989 RepID=A0A383U2B9_9FLAO|nr:galactokinase [Candidatus Ornithobacterium hominis]MCT7904673.1 galactokinase [Candidatus Ornithobacterium hominis]SZD73985.1 Galactokinase [Candidatus Ornithobacterium hominis]
MKDFLKEEFKKVYNSTPDFYYFAPARVNLIGEHIDYNGGLVMPAALENGTYLTLRTTNDKKLHFHSLNFPEENFDFELTGDKYTKKENFWVNYPLGVINAFMEKGFGLDTGMEFLFYGNIPNGGGLSSSASIEVVMAFALNSLLNAGLNRTQIALLAQKVENEFVGVNCGIMDQFAVSQGKEEHAIILDCQNLNFDYTPFVLEDHKLVIINTNKERKLADSKYNERRATCEEALEILNQQGKNYPDLCSVPMEYFESHHEELNEEQLKRVRHVISEQQRVLKSKEALANNDIKLFAQLMNESHTSLKNDYEVTGNELDTVNEESLKLPYVIGCRMTGAGFGGCAIAIVEKDKVEEYKSTLKEKYTEKIGYAPSIYEMNISDGVKEL